jgi:hypothetical protein
MTSPPLDFDDNEGILTELRDSPDTHKEGMSSMRLPGDPNDQQ